MVKIVLMLVLMRAYCNAIGLDSIKMSDKWRDPCGDEEIGSGINGKFSQMYKKIGLTQLMLVKKI